jgi:hypothetical protein
LVLESYGYCGKVPITVTSPALHCAGSQICEESADTFTAWYGPCKGWRTRPTDSYVNVVDNDVRPIVDYDCSSDSTKSVSIPPFCCKTALGLKPRLHSAQVDEAQGSSLHPSVEVTGKRSSPDLGMQAQTYFLLVFLVSRPSLARRGGFMLL